MSRISRSQWFRHLFTPSIKTRTRKRHPLRVERLEDRVTPSAQLQITPITWNVIGLDSNNVNVGPNTFLVGVRVANTGDQTATNVATDFTWDTANANINLSGPSSLSVSSLNAG